MGEGLRGFGGGTPPKFRGSARGRNAPSPLFKAEGLLSKKQYNKRVLKRGVA